MGDVDAARRGFASFVAARDAIAPAEVEIVDRDELHTPPYYCFAAIGPGPYLRGLAQADGEVLTHAQPDAFGRWLRGVGFVRERTSDAGDAAAGADAADAPDAAVSAAQFVQIHRLLRPPDPNPYAEGSFPLLYPQQLASAPTGGLAEAIGPPTVEDAAGSDCDVRRVNVWWQLEPGAQFELRTYTVTAGGACTIQRRPARAHLP